LQQASSIPKRPQLQELLELTNRLSEPLQAEEVALVIVGQARTAVGALTAIMWTVDDPPTHATLLRASGHEPGMLEHYARIPLAPWLPMGDAMLRLEPLFIESRAEFRVRYGLAEKLVGEQMPLDEVSYACLPLVAHGRSIGGVSLAFPQARSFDPEERMFLTVLAHHAAQALERAALFERERQARQRLESMQRLTSALSSAATVEDVATLATRVGVEALGLASGMLWVTDDRGDLCLLSEHGLSDYSRETFGRIPGDSTLPAARIARDRRAQWCETERDIESEDPSVVAVVGQGNIVRAYAALPLVRRDRVLGVLVFSAGRQHQFGPEERAFITTIAEHCADALARARLHDDASSTKQLLQSVLERLPVGVIVARPPDSTLVLTNDALGRIWRTDRLPILGEDPSKMLNVRFPDGRPMPRSESPIVRALHGESLDGLDAQIERRDGTTGWIQVSAAPVVREDGRVDVAVATVVDVTALKEARAAADEAARAKDEFLAMLGHELRNPLTPILTALHLMDLHGGEAFRAERTMMSHQLRHVLRLVDDLLDISRITRGEVLLNKERVEISQVVASAVETVRPMLEQRSHVLTVSVPTKGLLVVADPGRLTQAVVNLLVNASKYTEPGGSIAVVAAREDRTVCIRVRDTGIGIESEVLAKVFDLFVQAKRSIARSQGGLGIGLTVVRNLVELSGGSVSAHSAGVGCGSEFVIRLPIEAAAEASPVATELPLARGPANVKPCRVLVVDDNVDITCALAAILENLGCVTQVAHDGPSAIAAAASFGPDLALLDIGLPEMDGYELARRLRRGDATATIRLVALTGYGQASDKQRALEAGFHEHVVKPIELDTLRDVLTRVDARHADVS
jgi:PAS domain S-box-containing protein